MLIRGLLLTALVALAGCLESTAPDGYLVCSGVPGRQCPMGYYCETVSQTCWHNGLAPDMTLLPDPPLDFSMATPPDLAQPLDLSTSD
jgi:hypothetical protein